METLRERYEICKDNGLAEKAEYLLLNLDETLRINCDACNSNVFQHECLADGTTVDKLIFSRHILTHASSDTDIDSIIDVAVFLVKNKEKLSDIREVYGFKELENPNVNFSPPSSPQSLPDIVDLSSDDENDLPLIWLSTSSNYPQQKSKFGKVLGSKRGKARKQLFARTPYVKTEHSFQLLGDKLKRLNREYHELSLNQEFVTNGSIREKQAIASVISNLNQAEGVYASVDYSNRADELLKIEYEKREIELKLQYEEKLNQTRRSVEDIITCSVCLENKKSRTCVPCGHNFCVPCSDLLSARVEKTCGYCRQKIDKVIPLFL